MIVVLYAENKNQVVMQIEDIPSYLLLAWLAFYSRSASIVVHYIAQDADSFTGGKDVK